MTRPRIYKSFEKKMCWANYLSILNLRARMIMILIFRNCVRFLPIGQVDFNPERVQIIMVFPYVFELTIGVWYS